MIANTQHLFDCIRGANQAARDLRAAGWIISFGERDGEEVTINAQWHGLPPSLGISHLGMEVAS